MKKRDDYPRVVVVTRKSPLELMLERYGTEGQVRFFLETRGQSIDTHEEAHRRQRAGVDAVLNAIPVGQRRTRVDRDDLDRFLFSDDDLVVVVGQDGLVANVAKYLRGQRLIGVNPDPDRYDGVLCVHEASAFAEALGWATAGGAEFRVEDRPLVEARRDDGLALLALNEIFVGHRTHQSARYRLRVGSREERQSSSGLICASGTGATGWTRSIVEQRDLPLRLPAPTESRFSWFVREPFPSIATGTALDHGICESGACIRVVSEMGEGGVAFGDGIERDAIEFGDGMTITLRIADDRLRLVVPAA